MKNNSLLLRFLPERVLKGLLALLFVCSLSCANAPHPRQRQYRIDFTTEKELGSMITFSVNAAEEDQADVWFDCNNNGVQDKGEKITRFGFSEEKESSFPIQAQRMTLYGKITAFGCSSNQLVTLDVRENPALEYLSCGANKIKSLDVHANPRLETLYCYDNKLQSLDVSANTALERLWCDDNRINVLDVSKNEELRELWCHGNRIESLDVRCNRHLEELCCGGNRLTELNIRENTELTKLECMGNELTSLDVSANTALTKLFCSFNKLTELDLQRNKDLQKLWCESNFMTTLDVSANPKLKTIDCSDNNLRGPGMEAFIRSLHPCPSEEAGELVIIDTSANATDKNICTQNQADIARAKNWVVYAYNGESEEEYRGVNTGKYSGQSKEEYRNVHTAEDTEINIGLDYRIRLVTMLQPYYDKLKLTVDAAEADRDSVWLDLNDNGHCDDGEKITVFGTEQTYMVDSRTLTLYGKVHTLICTSNKLKMLDIHENPALTELKCGANALQDLHIDNNTALIKLWCGFCDLKTLNLSSNTKLMDLYCAGNELSSLNVRNNPLLEQLDCSNNTIEALDVRNNTRLIKLICFNNRLTDLDIRANTGIERLFCGENPLGRLDTASLTKLAVLSCSQNQLSALDVSKNTALKELYCSDNRLTVLDLAANTALTTVICLGNELRDNGMDTLMQSLKTCAADKQATLVIIDSAREPPDQNVCSKTQVGRAKAKNWQVMDWNDGKQIEYEGVKDDETASFDDRLQCNTMQSLLLNIF